MAYFDLKKAFNEAKESLQQGGVNLDSMQSVAKLISKSAANLGKVAAQAGSELVYSSSQNASVNAQKKLKEDRNQMSQDEIDAMVNIINEAHRQELKKKSAEIHSRYEKLKMTEIDKVPEFSAQIEEKMNFLREAEKLNLRDRLGGQHRSLLSSLGIPMSYEAYNAIFIGQEEE